MNWLNTLYPDRWPVELHDLWERTQRFFEHGPMDPIWGEGSTWYFWDETWTDACGPFPTEADARVAVHRYAETL